mmetsp:Transcript_76904/g.126892  ORF Transcript_76904/g.126892 Transcript_76904/m.126892 type:complete len:207 (+) Transcript_76904:153-773(+)
MQLHRRHHARPFGEIDIRDLLVHSLRQNVPRERRPLMPATRSRLVWAGRREPKKPRDSNQPQVGRQTLRALPHHKSQVQRGAGPPAPRLAVFRHRAPQWLRGSPPGSMHRPSAKPLSRAAAAARHRALATSTAVKLTPTCAARAPGSKRGNPASREPRSPLRWPRAPSRPPQSQRVATPLAPLPKAGPGMPGPNAYLSDLVGWLQL